MKRARAMKCLQLALGSALMLFGAAHAADAPAVSGPLYVTSFVEVAPSATAKAVAALETYRDATRRETGAQSADLYQEKGWPSRFVVSEIWAGQAALDAHEKAAAMAKLREAIEAVSFKPIDVRPHTAYIVTPPTAPKSGDVFVISHIDVYGPGVPVLQAAFRDLADAAKNENGMVRYEVLDQTAPHANHYRLFEEWASEKDWETHNLGAAVQAFHAKLPVYLGTPYDQRIYDLVK
jgi:quinol monooxygenase YgiN